LIEILLKISLFFSKSQDNFPLMKCPISVQDGGGIP
jgi:hypothetical protein